MVRKSCSTGFLSTANSFAPEILQRSLSSQLGGPNVWQTFHAPREFEFSIEFSMNFHPDFDAQKGWKSQVPLASLFTLSAWSAWSTFGASSQGPWSKGLEKVFGPWQETQFGAWNMAGFIPGVMPSLQIRNKMEWWNKIIGPGTFLHFSTVLQHRTWHFLRSSHVHLDSDPTAWIVNTPAASS